MKRYLSFRVVVPSLNQGNFIAETLRSVVEQKYPGSVQIAVMDGGSTDSSLEIIKSYSDQIDFFKSDKDDGQSSAINEGFSHVTGDISFYLNSDDVLLPDALMKVNTYFSENPDVTFLYSHRIIIDEFSNVCDHWRLPKYKKSSIRQTDLIPQETLYWKTSEMSEIGNLDSNLKFAMDYDFIFRLMENGKGLRVDDYFSAFRYHDNSKTHNLLDSVGRYEIEMIQKRYKVKVFPFLAKLLSFQVKLNTKIFYLQESLNRNKKAQVSIPQIWGWKYISTEKHEEPLVWGRIIEKITKKRDSIMNFCERNIWFISSLTFSLFMAAMALLFSFKKGRLSQQLSYDDVTYIIDAGGRIRNGDFLSNFIKQPPHSPYDAILASSALKIFGFRDYSPYIFGAVAFALLITTFAYSLRIAKRHSFYTSLLLSFSSLGYMGYTEFRPDIPNAVATALGSIFMLRRDTPMKLGVGFFLLASWIKPSFIPQTLILLAASFLIRKLLVKREPFEIQYKKISYLVFYLGLLLSMSYYSFAIEKTFDYLVVGTSTQYDVWSFPDTVSNLGSYLWYSGFQRNSSTVVIGSIMGISLAFSSLKVFQTAIQKSTSLFTHNGIHLWVLGFISFSIMALSRFPNHFFGSTAALLFFASSMIFISLSRYSRYVLACFFLFSLTMCMLTLSHIDRGYPSRDSSVIDPASKVIFETMENNSIESLYLPFQGQVNSVTLNWENMKMDGKFSIDDSSVMPTIEQSSKRGNELGAILCPKPEADYYTYLPSAETTKILCDSKAYTKGWTKIDMPVNFYILLKNVTQ